MLTNKGVFPCRNVLRQHFCWPVAGEFRVVHRLQSIRQRATAQKWRVKGRRARRRLQPARRTHHGGAASRTAETNCRVADTVVRAGDPVPITVREVADVRYAGPVRRGDASIEGDRSIILSIQKQPGADTLELTSEIEHALHGIQERLPQDVVVSTEIFKQADFIDAAIDNVKEAIRDGVIWVIVVLFIFLWNLRTSLITLTAIPLSIIITALAFSYFGVSINTMTLGDWPWPSVNWSTIPSSTSKTSIGV